MAVNYNVISRYFEMITTLKDLEIGKNYMIRNRDDHAEYVEYIGTYIGTSDFINIFRKQKKQLDFKLMYARPAIRYNRYSHNNTTNIKPWFKIEHGEANDGFLSIHVAEQFRVSDFKTDPNVEGYTIYSLDDKYGQLIEPNVSPDMIPEIVSITENLCKRKVCPGTEDDIFRFLGSKKRFGGKRKSKKTKSKKTKSRRKRKQ